VVVHWDPASAVSGPFEEVWGVSVSVGETVLVNSEAEGHWFESGSARHYALETGFFRASITAPAALGERCTTGASKRKYNPADVCEVLQR